MTLKDVSSFLMEMFVFIDGFLLGIQLLYNEIIHKLVCQKPGFYSKKRCITDRNVEL